MLYQDLKSAKILVVDDQEANIDILVGLFEYEGYTNVTTTTDSREFMDLFRSVEPDLILLDLMMPYLSGYDILAQLKEEIPPDINLPILVLTADVSSEAKLKALSNGAMDFLVKPFDVMEVGLRIRNLLLSRFLYLRLQQQNQELQEVNEIKSKFISMASHEFKTPLASILMSAETLNTYWKRMTDDQIHLKIRTVIEQVDHLSEIVSDVMQVMKIQTGRVKKEPERVDLITLCHEVVKEFNASPSSKWNRDALAPGQTDESYSETGPISFYSTFSHLELVLDKKLLLQILKNLVSNAIKYAPINPKIGVAVYHENGVYVIRVEDNGIGIPEADQKFLFQPFFRAGNTTQIEGNGLGLNIAIESAHLLGGNLTFQSRLGEGSTFFLHLPVELTLISTE